MSLLQPDQRALGRVIRLAGYMGYALGGLCLVLALAVYATQWSLPDLAGWANRMFGIGFISAYSLLFATGIYACLRISDSANARFWRELGEQAASLIATLALTFTLLGISLGIGSLAGQALTPESVNQIMQILTRQFSVAFMTTIVGLPTASVLRACLAVRFARLYPSQG